MADDRRTIALDFDGVLHSYDSGWTGVEPEDLPVPGAQDFVRKLIDKGFHVVIFSARANEFGGRSGIHTWLKKYGFPHLDVETSKPHADVYIDDRAYRFEGDFEDAFSFCTDDVLSRPWSKKPHDPAPAEEEHARIAED